MSLKQLKRKTKQISIQFSPHTPPDSSNIKDVCTTSRCLDKLFLWWGVFATTNVFFFFLTFWKKNFTCKIGLNTPFHRHSCDSERTSTLLCFFVRNMQQQTVRFKAVIASTDKALSHHKLQQVQGSSEHFFESFHFQLFNTCPQAPNNMHVDILLFNS